VREKGKDKGRKKKEERRKRKERKERTVFFYSPPSFFPSLPLIPPFPLPFPSLPSLPHPLLGKNSLRMVLCFPHPTLGGPAKEEKVGVLQTWWRAPPEYNHHDAVSLLFFLFISPLIFSLNISPHLFAFAFP